jgi:hypothetical protein
MRPSPRLQTRARWILVAAGAALALGAAQCPWLAARLALAGIGAWMLGKGLGLASATALFSAVAYLGSGALLAFGPRGDLVSYPSLAEIGTLLATLALVRTWRRAAPDSSGPRWAGALGILLALCACFWCARAAGLASESSRWLPLLVASPVLAFAGAGLAAEKGVLRGRGVLQAATLGALFAAVHYPDRCALVAAPAALGLALCAGDGLEAAPRAARALGAACCALLAILALGAGGPAPLAASGEPLDGQEAWVSWHRLAALPGELAYEVEVDARVPVAAVVLAFVSETDGRRVEWPMQRAAIPAGARFTHAPVRRAHFRDPAWSVELELVGQQGLQIGKRVIDRLVLPQAPALSPALLGFLAAALLLCATRAAGARLALAAALLAALQAAWLYARV